MSAVSEGHSFDSAPYLVMPLINTPNGVDGESWGSTHVYEEGGGSWSDTPLPHVPLPTTGAGIYSDLPEFPNSDSPTSPVS